MPRLASPTEEGDRNAQPRPDRYYRQNLGGTCRKKRVNCYNRFMPILAALLLSFLTEVAAEPASGHEANTVYTQVIRDGIDLGGQRIRLPEPLLKDGQEAEAQNAALLGIAGSDRALSDLQRDSVTAPYILKVHDVKTNSGVMRLVDLWFVVRASLEDIEPMKIAAQASGRTVGAGNMEFRDRLLTAEELKPRGRSAVSGRELSRWYSHVEGKLLDRIEVAATSEVVASRTADSLIIASRTDRAFDAPGPFANRWRAVGHEGAGADQVYDGGISYARIDRLERPDGALLVEVHAAFIEPEPWFHGAPILRSKFAPVAQDQIRRLRRELQKERSKAGG